MSKQWLISNANSLGSGATDIGNDLTASTVSSRSRLAYAGAGGTGVHLSGIYVVTAGVGTNTLIDGEMRGTFFASNGAGVRTGVHARVVNYSGSNYRGYFVRETSAADATSWDLVSYDTATDVATTIATLKPSGVSNYTNGVTLAYAVIGTRHFLKIWDASTSEPAWAPNGNCLWVDNATYTAGGAWGQTAWDANAAGFYVEANAFYLAVANSVVLVSGGSNAGDTANTTSYTATSVITASAGEPLLIVVETSHSAEAPAPLAWNDGTTPWTLPAGMVVADTTPWQTIQFNTTSTHLNRLSVFRAKASVDISAATMTVTFPNAQTGCSFGVVRCSGAENKVSDGAGAFVHGAITANDTNSTSSPSLTLAAFTNAVGTSSTVAAYGHIANESPTADTAGGWVSLATGGNYATPANSLATHALYGNDTTPTATWATSSKAAVFAAEVQADPWALTEYSGIYSPPVFIPRAPGKRAPSSLKADRWSALQDRTTATSTVFQQALSAVHTQTTTYLRSVGKFVSATETQTPSYVRSIAKTASATETQTPTVVKSVGKPLSATETQTPSYSKSVGKTASATETQTPSFVRSVGKTVSATETQTPSVIKSVSKTLSALHAQTASMLAQLAHILTMSVTQTQTSTIVRSIGKLLTSTETQTPTYTRSTGKTVSATETQTPSYSKSVGKLASATETQTPSFVRSVGKLISATDTQTPSMLKSVSKTLSAAHAQTATILAQLAHILTMSVTQTQTASFVRSIGKTLAATHTQTPTYRRAITHAMSVVQTQTASLIKSITKTLTATHTQTATITAGFAILRTLVVSVGRVFTKWNHGTARTKWDAPDGNVPKWRGRVR